MTQTRWYVITGAPCSGKTAVIRELERRGRHVVHEAARELIDRRLAAGIPLAEIKSDEAAFERAILAAKLAAEARLPADRQIFFDRGVPDSLAYFRAAGLAVEAVLATCRRVRYAGVFHFQRLRFQPDAVRSEDDRTAEKLDRLLAAGYRELGYDPRPVPVMPVAARADRVLALAREDHR